MSEACTWPEQDAVDAWLEKHKIDVPFAAAMELKSAVTAYRIEVQDLPPTLAEALAVPELRALVEAATILRNGAGCGCDGPSCSSCSDNGIALDAALAAIRAREGGKA